LTSFSLVGCSGKDEASSSSTTIEGLTDEQLDAAVERTQNGVKNALKAQGIGSDTAKGGYAVSGGHDGESVSMGVDLDTPAWLPADFPLPDDLSITLVATDKKQARKELRGRSASVQQSNIADLVAQWAASHNWELVRSTDMMLTLANNDGEIIDLRADDRVELAVILSQRDISAERQEVAPVRKGSGRAEFTVANDKRVVQGECLIKGSSYQFEFSAQDGSVFASVQIQNANNTATGSATFMTNAGGKFEQFNINFPMNNDQEPVVTVSSDKFSVSGVFASMGGGGMSIVEGNMSVNCEF
jgi:hypothetical protein